MMNETHPYESKYPPEFLPFWNGLREGRIGFPKCTRCGQINWYPMERCSQCLGEEFERHNVSGKGRLYSWTIVRRAFSPKQAGMVPYVVGLVEFEEVPGTRLITNIIACDFEDLSIDMEVEPVFSFDEDLPMVRFRPTGPVRKAVSE